MRTVQVFRGGEPPLIYEEVEGFEPLFLVGEARAQLYLNRKTGQIMTPPKPAEEVRDE